MGGNFSYEEDEDSMWFSDTERVNTDLDVFAEETAPHLEEPEHGESFRPSSENVNKGTSPSRVGGVLDEDPNAKKAFMFLVASAFVIFLIGVALIVLNSF